MEIFSALLSLCEGNPPVHRRAHCAESMIIQVYCYKELCWLKFIFNTVVLWDQDKIAAFFRHHFQINFLVRNMLYFDLNFTKICS